MGTSNVIPQYDGYDVYEALPHKAKPEQVASARKLLARYSETWNEEETQRVYDALGLKREAR